MGSSLGQGPGVRDYVGTPLPITGTRIASCRSERPGPRSPAGAFRTRAVHGPCRRDSLARPCPVWATSAPLVNGVLAGHWGVRGSLNEAERNVLARRRKWQGLQARTLDGRLVNGQVGCQRWRRAPGDSRADACIAARTDASLPAWDTPSAMALRWRHVPAAEACRQS